MLLAATIFGVTYARSSGRAFLHHLRGLRGVVEWRHETALRGYTLVISRDVADEKWLWHIEPDGFAWLHMGAFTDFPGLFEALDKMKDLIRDLPTLEPQWEASRAANATKTDR